jgi:hypothetical protein
MQGTLPMPLPSVLIGAKQCQVTTKRTKKRCKNPAAYGCASCRMHGAHKSRKVLKGKAHPQYKHGRETTEAKELRSRKSAIFLYLRDMGDIFGIFSGAHTRGRKPLAYKYLDLKTITDLNKVILAIEKSGAN